MGDWCGRDRGGLEGRVGKRVGKNGVVRVLLWGEDGSPGFTS